MIVAGGINSHEAVRELLTAGASGLQLGTPFAVTEEGDAHPNFKRVLADATPDDIVEFVSVTGLPARAVKTPWLMRYLRNETRIREKIGALKAVCPTALECLSVCGWRDGVRLTAKAKEGVTREWQPGLEEAIWLLDWQGRRAQYRRYGGDSLCGSADACAFILPHLQVMRT